MINEIQKTDYQFIISIWQKAMPPAHPHISKDQWSLISPNFCHELNGVDIGYTYKDNDIIVGFIFGFKKSNNSCYIQELCVDPVFQGKGIGKTLLNYLKDSYEQLNLHVYLQNTGGIAFYKRENFKEGNIKICDITGCPKILMIWDRNFSNKKE